MLFTPIWSPWAHYYRRISWIDWHVGSKACTHKWVLMDIELVGLLFHLPSSLICHWESPACTTDVAPLMHRLCPECLEGLSSNLAAVALMWLTSIKWSRALPSTWRKGASGGVCLHLWDWMMHQALHALHTAVPVQSMMIGQPSWKGSVLLPDRLMHMKCKWPCMKWGAMSHNPYEQGYPGLC